MTSSCDRAREALSARIDDEASADDVALLDAHLPGCGPCREHATALESIRRRSRVAAARPVPDLSAAIVRDVASELEGVTDRHSERTLQLRVVVALAGLVQAVLAVPSLLAAAGAHSGRDLAAFELALGASFVVAALRPRLAAGLLPFVALVAAASVAVGVAELVAGETRLLAELSHVVPLLALPFVRGLADHADTPVPQRAVPTA